MAQIIKIKGNKTNANATPSSLVERELASNLVDRCLFGSDGTSVFKYYTGSTKYFDANGYANNANKLGGQTIDYFASADGVVDALDEIIDFLKGYQPLITSTNKLAYSLISGVPTSLKNPNALTINNSAGTAQVSYDGSAVKSLTLTKAMVGLGNVENTALSTWVGTNKITTLGTITTGVWNGTKIANGYLANSAINIGGTSVSLGGSITAATLQANLGLGTFAYKSSLAFADLTNKPTTIGGYGITDAYTKSQVDSALGGYLPLSGGTINGNLIVSNSNGIIGIEYTQSNSKGYLIYQGGTNWRVTDNGWANSYYIIHSGNIGSQSVASATKLATSRKLWGQSFNGENDVNGHLSIGTIMGQMNANRAELSIVSETDIPCDLWLGNSAENVWSINCRASNENRSFSIYHVFLGHLFRIDGASGNVGIGTTSPQYKLDVNGTLHASGAVTFGSSLSMHGTITSDHFIIMDRASNSYLKLTEGTVYNCFVQIMQNGDLALGSTSTKSLVIGQSGDTIVNGVLRATTGIFSDGYVSAKGQNTSSDMRLKNVLGDVVLSVKDIANAPSIRFSWKNGGGVDVGSSAQYWQGLLPDAVKERDGMLEMQYANIALLSAIALAKNFETHEERIARLECENEELKNKIDMMERGIA